MSYLQAKLLSETDLGLYHPCGVEHGTRVSSSNQSDFATTRAPSPTLKNWDSKPIGIIDDSDKRWLAYLRAHVGNLELLPAIVTHRERTAKPITRPLKVEELRKAFGDGVPLANSWAA